METPCATSRDHLAGLRSGCRHDVVLENLVSETRGRQGSAATLAVDEAR